MSAQHTQTPWVHNTAGYPKADIIGSNGRNIAHTWNVAASPAKTAEALKARTAEDRANARHIVACVNACEGITTERLEDLGRPLMQHLIGCDERAARQVKEAAALTAQRDDLLSALKLVTDRIEFCASQEEMRRHMPTIEHARAVIAKVEETAA